MGQVDHGARIVASGFGRCVAFERSMNALVIVNRPDVMTISADPKSNARGKNNLKSFGRGSFSTTSGHSDAIHFREKRRRFSWFM
jgi:hypothetical protein